jgi:hypothetical protein
MCDYSLEHLKARPAVVADKLVTTAFRRTLTRGFAAIDDPSTAVCLRPGTELVFERAPRYDLGFYLWFWPKTAPGTTARFRKVDPDVPTVHHDALEFWDGTTVLLDQFRCGQQATVLQLPVDTQCDPAKPQGTHKVSEQLT